MKNKIVPTGRERSLKDDTYIVSKTDPKGKITYANRIFMEISGYGEADLIGVQHNILRHPDMPRGAFKLMWDTISTGKEFFAYVINLCRNGDHYWVLANITPDYDVEGQIVGYFSVRRLPNPEVVKALIPVYAQMVAEEKRVGAKGAMDASQAILMNLIREAGHDSYETFILSL
jgi:PAS domain S-box-containing protein